MAVLHVWLYTNNWCNAGCYNKWSDCRFPWPKMGMLIVNFLCKRRKFEDRLVVSIVLNFVLSFLKILWTNQAMRVSATFCITGWLAIYFSEVYAVS